MPKKHAGVSKDPKRNTWTIHTKMTLPNGQKVAIHKRGFNTEREAIEELELIREQNLKDYESAERYISWKEGCLDYWAHYSNKVKATTAANAFLTYNRRVIKPFEFWSVENVVQLKNVKAFKQDLLKTNMSTAHINLIIKYFKKTIDYLYQLGKVTINEFKLANLELESVSFKNSFKKERPVWSQEEFRKFIDTFDENDKVRVLFEILGHTGCRVSELRGLQVKCYNYEKSELTIRQQVTSKLHNGSWTIVPPKTEKSVRTIGLSKRINELLHSYIEDMRYSSEDFIFFGKNPVGESTIRRFLNIHAKMAKLQLIPIHSLRHSNTTWLLSNKNLSLAEIGKISERLGHNSKKVTLDIYYHLNDVSNEKILDALI